LIGILSHLNIHILGGGHHTITEILQSMISDWKVLIILFTLKFFVTALCYSTGVSGGLFMPILLMGACMGGVVGSLSLSFFPGSVQNIGAFALVGMGAYFAAVIRSPFTSIIMVFEMTRDYNIILPLMIANIVSYLISSNFLKGSIYDYISEQDGVHLPTIGEDHEILDNLVIEDAMNKAPYCLTSELPVLQAFKKVKNSPYSGFPVLKNGLLVGMISRNDLKAKCAKGLGEKAIQDVCTKTIVKVYPDQSLLLAFHKLKKYHISRIPIVSRINDKEIVGIITPEDIVNQFGYHIQEESSKSNPLS
jgi:CIC family chloride channel protein